MGTKIRQIVDRPSWEWMIELLDGDIQATLRSELTSWQDGDSCEFVEYTPDSKGNPDSMSAPCPGAQLW